MIIDKICDRMNGAAYNPREFYSYLMQDSDKYSQMISAALDGGENSDVQNALCKYIQENNYNTTLIDYVNGVDWLNADAIYKYIDIILTKYEPQIINLSAMIYNGDNWWINLNTAICEFAGAIKETDKDFDGVELREIGAAINEAICTLTQNI